MAMRLNRRDRRWAFWLALALIGLTLWLLADATRDALAAASEVLP